MDLKHRLTSFVILHAGWIVWLVVGLSTGGLLSVLQRTVTLLGTSPGVRRFAATYLLPSHGGRPSHSAVAADSCPRTAALSAVRPRVEDAGSARLCGWHGGC